MKRQVAQFSGKVKHFRVLIQAWKRIDAYGRGVKRGGHEVGPALGG